MTIKGQLLSAILLAVAGSVAPATAAEITFQTEQPGAVAGITEMLLQSQKHYTDPKSGRECYVLELLPALPKAWPTGSVHGLRARGGWTVDIQWRDGKLLQAIVHSLVGGSARLHYHLVTREVKLDRNETASWNGT